MMNLYLRNGEQMAVERDQRGRYIPGHNGNQGGRPQGLASYIREQTDDGVEIVALMLRVLRGQVRGFKPHHRLEAATWLADRGWGKATQMMEVVAQVSAVPGQIDWDAIPDDLAEELLALNGKIIALQPGSGGFVINDNDEAATPR